MPSPFCRTNIVLTALLVAGLLGGCQSSPEASSAPAEETSQATSTVALPDSVLTPSDTAAAARFEDAMAHAWSHRAEAPSIGSLMQEVGLHFQGRPYLEGTLDEPPTETLVVRLDGFDCVTFVETTLALSRGALSSDSTYAGFANRLAEQRYRNGSMQGYCSRLHYFTEWLADNESRGIVRILDDELGGRSLPDTVDFMSNNRSAYDRFASNDSLFACIQDMEDRLQERPGRNSIRYVPQDSIRSVYDKLQAGDIVALVTSIEGLDVAHTGLVYAHENGDRGLLHASLSDGVVVSPDLQGYVEDNDHQIGIIVARPESVL